MKKITLSIMAVTMFFSAMAQSNEKSADKKNLQHKEYKGRHFKGGENLDKLNLTDAQKAQMKTVNESFKKQMKDLNSKGNITVDQQRQQREAIVKAHKEQVSAILTPEQRSQVAAHTKDFRGGRKDGVRGRNFSDITKDLNLSADQEVKMNAMNATFKSNVKSLRQNTSVSEKDKKEQMKKLMKQHRSDMEALLTNDQKEQLKSREKNRPNRTAVK
jgi:Spy/CpxP family protein refolding chaperone